MNEWISPNRIGIIAVCVTAVVIVVSAIVLTATDTTSTTTSACPTRIVSLSPTATENLFAIGAGPSVVAVDSDSDYPADAPRESTLIAYSPSAEAVDGDYKPDLVVVSYDANKVIEQLHTLGVNVLYQPTANTLADAYSQIRALGVATCRTAAASALVATMQTKIARIQHAAGASTAGLTYYDEISAPPSDYAASSQSFVGQLFTLLGMRNITNASGGFPELSQEAIVKAAPQLIFLSDNQPADGGVTVASVAQRPGWSTIPAVKDHAIFDLNDDEASRWGPRVPDLLQQIATYAADFAKAHPAKS